MNKTSTSYEAGRSPFSPQQPKSNAAPVASEPDMIIIPAHESFAWEGRHMGRERKFEYTAYEEIETAPSNFDDELAFQEYADDDPTRLRVSARRAQA